MSYKCTDCGTPEFKPCDNGNGRQDLCEDCFTLRGMLFPALSSRQISLPEFKALQTTIANSRGSGRGARAMREALGLDGAAL